MGETTTSNKYIDIRSRTQEKKDAEEIALDVEQAENQINTDLQYAKSKVLQKKKELNAQLNSSIFNTSSILNAERQVALAEKDVEDIAKLKAKLF